MLLQPLKLPSSATRTFMDYKWILRLRRVTFYKEVTVVTWSLDTTPDRDNAKETDRKNANGRAH